jgi:spore coat polysaccharide biosynthesis predicted glycosyltransferase SpsG
VKHSSAVAIEILSDGGRKYGFGHLRRSYTLAQKLRDCNFQIKFNIVSEEGSNLKLDFVSTNIKPSLQIIDLPYDILPWVDGGHAKTPTIALDYFGDARPTLTISLFEHRLPPPDGNRLCGLKYALIRESILQKETLLLGKDIMVMIGGSDINGVGGEAALKLSEMGKKVSLIQGPCVTNNYSTTLKNITVHKNPKNLENIMASCEWAITNGGGSMMEMMFLGKAVHVIPQTKMELNFAQSIFKKGALLGIGTDSINIPSNKRILEVSKRARELLDGGGANRISNLVKDLL